MLMDILQILFGLIVGAVIGFFITVMWPNIQKSINTQWENISTYKDK